MKKQQLLAFTVKSEGSRMDLDIYEAIGDSVWGDSVSAKDVLAQIRDQKPSEVFLRVNSGGGNLFDATAISNLLKATGAKVTVSIDGIAASAATHLWPLGSHVTMASNALMMIHKAWNSTSGNETEMSKMAEVLKKADELQATSYEQQAESRGVQISAARFKELMSEETWLTAEEALAHGLIDSIGEAISVAASVDVSAFRRPPTALVDRVAAAKAFTLPTAAASQQGTGHMDPKTMQAAIEAKDAELANAKAEHKAQIDALQKDAEAFKAESEVFKAEVARLTTELSASKLEADTLRLIEPRLKLENQTLTTQNAALVTERDKALADIAARDAKILEAEVDALVPSVLDPSERDNFIALAKTSRTLFDSMVAQRKPRSLTTQTVSSDISPAVSNAAVGADEKFDELVSQDLT